MVKSLIKGYEWIIAFIQMLVCRLEKQEGQTWMEYGMIIGGAILVIVLVMVLFGDKIMGLFSDINDAIEVRQPSQGW